MALGTVCCLRPLTVFVIASTTCAYAQLLVVSSNAASSSESFDVYNSSYGFPSTLKEFTGSCQLNFSYVSTVPISAWLSVEDEPQALLVLPNGRPCVNRMFCSVITNLNLNRRYFLLAENLSGSTARLILNTTAAASSASGCGQAGSSTIPPVIIDHQYIFDDSLGTFTAEITGAECISYLAVAYKPTAYSFSDTADVDGFISTLSDWSNWADNRYDDGSAVQVAASECPSNVSHCTATVRGLIPYETYVVSIAGGYDDKAKQDFGKVQVAYTAGSGGACDALDVVQFFTV